MLADFNDGDTTKFSSPQYLVGSTMQSGPSQPIHGVLVDRKRSSTTTECVTKLRSTSTLFVDHDFTRARWYGQRTTTALVTDIYIIVRCTP